MSTTLSGMKVVDLSRVLAGPWVTQTLADLGADVIKIERPGLGDDTRSWGPPYYDTQASVGEEDARLSAYFTSANRDKNSICIDIAQEKGRDLVASLARNADIFVENFKVGDLSSRGLDYETLAAENPRLIYCSITGFGQSGPYKNKPGYDFMIQAMGGLMSITGEPDEQSAGGPQKVGVALVDILTGLYATIAILAAVNERTVSGKGQYIDMALLDVMTASLANQAANYLVSGVAPERLGNAHPNIVPYQSFATFDSHMIVAVGNDKQFSRLCQVVGQSSLATHSDYETNTDRVKNREKLAEELQKVFNLKTTESWITLLENAGVPCGPINDIGQTFADPQVQHRKMKIDIDGMPLVANPIKYSRSELKYDKPPPRLGEDTDSVLGSELGLGPVEISKLREEGIVA